MEISLSELQSFLNGKVISHSLKIGNSYLVRCVTHYYVGRLISITDSDLVLEEASWVADTGRFSDCLKNGSLKEVEPFFGEVIVSRGAVVDITIWKHKLPSEQK